MSRIQNFAFIAFFLLCSVYSKERGVGADCDIWHWCDAGLDCFDYRCAVAVPEKEDGEVESAVFAISVSQQNVLPYNTSAPDQYMDLVGRIQAGQSAVASAVFTLPK